MILKINEVKTYTIKEFMEIQGANKIEESFETKVEIASRALDHIKTNKKMYMKLVVTVALFIHCNGGYAFANGLGEIESWMDSTFGSLIDLLMLFIKWGCLGMGLKSAGESLLHGGNLKQASMAGIMYWLGYIFLQLYPKFYTTLKF